MTEFEQFIAKLDEYEQQLKELWESYDPNDNNLKMEITALKMSITFTSYLVDILEYANNGTIDLIIKKARRILSIITYILSTSAIFINPQLTPPAILGSLYIFFRNKIDDRRMTHCLTTEQQDLLFDKIDHIENIYIEKTDAIFDRTLVFEDPDNIEKLEEPEKTERIVCNNLMNLLRENKKLELNDNNRQIIRKIIESSFNIENTNVDELVEYAKKEYNNLVDISVKLDKKDERLERLGRLLLKP